MSDVIKLSGVGVDCPDAGELARLLCRDHRRDRDQPERALGEHERSGRTIDFWTVPNHRPATWPDGTTPKQLHLDFYVDDLKATEARVLAAGASKYGYQPNSDHCYVYADPAGHPFCLSTWGNPDE